MEPLASDTRGDWCMRMPTRMQTYSGLCEAAAVVHVVIRTFPEAPTVLSNLNISATEAPAFWDAMANVHASLPALNDAGGSGYYFIQPQYNLNGTNAFAMTLMLLFPNVTDTARVNRLYRPLISALNGTAGIMTQYGSSPLPSFGQIISKILLPGPVGRQMKQGLLTLSAHASSHGIYSSQKTARRG